MELVNTEVAYKFIRERILSGAYLAGMPLLTKTLSKEIGVSRTPVRDALRQLETDGLVVVRPRIGASVRTMDLQEFKNLCGLRQALETYAAGLAAQNRTESELEEIRSALEAMRLILDRMIKTLNEKELLADLAREDVRFHLAIIDVAKNDLIKKEIMRHSLIHRVVSTPPKTRTLQSLSERRKVFETHRDIFNAIERKDASSAKEAMEKHLQDNLEGFIQRMGSDEEARRHYELGLATETF